MKTKQILVIGAGGFIGKHLCNYLRNISKVSVVGISRTIGKGHLKIDVTNLAVFKKFLARHKPAIIFHLAGGRSEDALKIISDNILTTVCLFKTIQSIQDYYPRVVVVGSAAEYGQTNNSRKLILENSSTQPISLYGQVKLMQSKMAIEYSTRGHDVVVARLFNSIGPSIPNAMAVGHFASCIVNCEHQSKKLKPFRVGHLGAYRDFLDIRDICEALYLLALKGKTGNIYNICSQKKVLMRDLLKQMISLSANPEIKFKEDRNRECGTTYAVGSCRKFINLTGWQPRYDLKTSIKDMLAFLQ